MGELGRRILAGDGFNGHIGLIDSTNCEIWIMEFFSELF